MDKDRFICQHCGKEYNIKDAVIHSETTWEKDGGSKVVGRKIVHTAYFQYEYIRFCKTCGKRRNVISKWNKTATIVICDVLIFFFLLVFTDYKGTDIAYIMFIAIPVLIIPAVIVESLLNRFYFKIDWQKAYEENAYPVSWLERSNNKQNKKV